MTTPGLDSFIRRGTPDSVNNGVRQTVGSARNIVDAVRNPSRFMSVTRSRNLPAGGEPVTRSLTQARVVTQSGERDWRVSLSVPNLSAFQSSMLEPLTETGNKMIFPYTPTIIMSHSSHYHGTNPTHTNYTYFNYVHSQVDQITIVGDFIVENPREGQYWIAVLHYLRSVTKMFYGDETNGGNPPPIIRLNGYGDYVFNNIPVVITNFTVDLQPDVDYIEAGVGGFSADNNFGIDSVPSLPNPQSGGSTSWVPTRSTITVAAQPIYSRKSVSQFSLSDFVAGNYVTNGKGFI
jgi:hypothetical protein